MADWDSLAARAGRAAHDVVGWLMWDPAAIAAFSALGVPDGAGWILAWRLAPLGDITPQAAAAATYSINADIIEMVMDRYRHVTSSESIAQVRNDSILAGLESIAPGLTEQLGAVAGDLWRGVDSVHHGAKPMFAAFRAEPRPESQPAGLSAWLALNCLRELRGDNHWALCAAAGLDDVEVGLLHSAMVDPGEYGGEEWIARSRGSDDEAISRGWARLEAKGLATDRALNDTGRGFRHEIEARTNQLCAPAWRAVGEAATVTVCDAVDAHHDAFLARIDQTAGPRWMPALRQH